MALLTKIPGLVFVGELNPHAQDPRTALYHLPRRAAGNRLRQHLGLPDRVYVRLQKVNLCVGRWSSSRAGRAALRILAEHDKIVCLGQKVAEVFEVPPQPFNVVRRGGKTFVTLPHPSGLCRTWNDPYARPQARQVMRDVAPEVAWGPSYW